VRDVGLRAAVVGGALRRVRRDRAPPDGGSTAPTDTSDGFVESTTGLAALYDAWLPASRSPSNSATSIVSAGRGHRRCGATQADGDVAEPQRYASSNSSGGCTEDLLVVDRARVGGERGEGQRVLDDW
jgi:hypothetical protein